MILPQALACAYLSDSYYWILLNYPITVHFQLCLSSQNCQSYVIVTEITIPPIINTRATRDLHSKQLLTQDSGLPFHSDQNKYSHVPISKELPELFEVQVCLPLLFAIPSSCMRICPFWELSYIAVEWSDLYLLKFFIPMFLMVIALFLPCTYLI